MERRAQVFSVSKTLAFAVMLVALWITGCGYMDSELSGLLKLPKLNDFIRSEIIANGPKVADGSSELLIVIQLLNSDGSPVALFRPTYEILSGNGVNASACTISNSNGVSTCVLKSTVAGTKRLAVTNINIPLQADVVFTNPAAGKPIFGLISSRRQQTQGNFNLSATVGNQEPGAIKKSGSYQLFGGVQGEGFSR